MIAGSRCSLFPWVISRLSFNDCAFAILIIIFLTANYAEILPLHYIYVSDIFCFIYFYLLLFILFIKLFLSAIDVFDLLYFIFFTPLRQLRPQPVTSFISLIFYFADWFLVSSAHGRHAASLVIKHHWYWDALHFTLYYAYTALLPSTILFCALVFSVSALYFL
jgi:hypothetical protein